MNDHPDRPQVALYTAADLVAALRSASEERDKLHEKESTRPTVDDPRVLALAKARQQIAYESPLNFVCPPWDGLSEQEQETSLLAARNWLHAALRAGLVTGKAAA
ncbi:hypothetical protein [Streptomyces sp. enrichment culture]|uniref:hypothetical protein n=1 Tax=Streptomyces sp. enrichment culture TaxID=1795815 RepID=UPI003F552162